jgi:hypothetical protein
VIASGMLRAIEYGGSVGAVGFAVNEMSFKKLARVNTTLSPRPTAMPAVLPTGNEMASSGDAPALFTRYEATPDVARPSWPQGSTTVKSTPTSLLQPADDNAAAIKTTEETRRTTRMTTT